MISNKAFKAIAALDLEPIKTKLMHAASGEGWSRAKVDAMEIEYRRFLYLMQAFPEEQTAPTVDVDTFWHYHILDTVKYAADCEQAFGYFMHHFPYLGLQGEDDAGDEERGADRMRDLYEATFGEAYIREEAYGAAVSATAYCIRTDPPKTPAQGASAAYCIRTDPPKAAAPGASAAYCIRTDPPKAAGASAAYCIRTDPPKAAGASAAYCIRTDPPKAHAGAIVIKGKKVAAAGVRRPGVKTVRGHAGSTLARAAGTAPALQAA